MTTGWYTLYKRYLSIYTTILWYLHDLSSFEQPIFLYTRVLGKLFLLLAWGLEYSQGKIYHLLLFHFQYNLQAWSEHLHHMSLNTTNKLVSVMSQSKEHECVYNECVYNNYQCYIPCSSCLCTTQCGKLGYCIHLEMSASSHYHIVQGSVVALFHLGILVYKWRSSLSTLHHNYLNSLTTRNISTWRMTI